MAAVTAAAGATSARSVELAANLAAFEHRLSAACAAAGRPRDEVTLIAVTKTFPSSDVEALCAFGLRDFGENRDQEARAKAAAVPTARWHFVGRLQRNKCRSVASYADAVHSVDRIEVAEALAEGARRADRLIDVLIQVSLDGDPARGGVVSDGVTELATVCAAADHLRLSGVMALAPQQEEPDAAFARLAQVAAALRAEFPRADAISAGMSADLEPAIRHGATHVRIGTALLGGRKPLSG